MNRKKDHKGWDGPRPFKLVHQALCLSSINFQKRSVTGHVELTVVPVTGLRRLRLNCKQCRIYGVRVNGAEAAFTYSDPMLEVCRPGGDAKQRGRSLAGFAAALAAAAGAVDPDLGRGELDIEVPKLGLSQPDPGGEGDPKALRVRVDFHLERPEGGLHFVVPGADGDGSMADRAAHVFSVGHRARLWFPCVDSYSELCTWRLEFTVDASMTAVSCGDLLETVYTQDMSRKTFRYALHVPTAAPNIALAAGPFQILPDPGCSPHSAATHFCLPRLLPLLCSSTVFLRDALDFLEEALQARYPYSGSAGGGFKAVFVDEAYTEASAYASMCLLSTGLLHSAGVIDQAPRTRRALARALACQYFGCFVRGARWADRWVPEGVAGYIYGLYVKRAFGVNEYRHWVSEELDQLVEYELRTGDAVALHPTISNGSGRSAMPPSHLHFAMRRPHALSREHRAAFRRKAHLLMRLIEKHVGAEFMLQVLAKLLSLAGTASAAASASATSMQPKAMMTTRGAAAAPPPTWSQMLVSTDGFLRLISAVSGKDVAPLVAQWADRGGAIFHGSFAFNRKRNVLELEIQQDSGEGGASQRHYVGPVRVTVQELDGSFDHTLQLEGGGAGAARLDIPCHSKSRRNKKKKIPLASGEEVDMDLSATDADSPVLWVRVDPDLRLLRRVHLQQADTMWQYQLRFERDAVAQAEAATALEAHPTAASVRALADTAEDERCFYRVRVRACFALARISGHVDREQRGLLRALFTGMFCCKTCPDIIRPNDFGDFQSYFLQKAMPAAMTLLREEAAPGICCPQDVLGFVVGLIKYNDNQRNAFSDGYYRAALVDALANALTVPSPGGTSSSSLIVPPGTSSSLTPPGTPSGDGGSKDKATAEGLSAAARLVLGEIARFLNLEKLQPSFRNAVTVHCLAAIRRLQRSGHVPADPSLFVSYAQYGHFVDVRVAALEALADYAQDEEPGSPAELARLLGVAEGDPVPYVRHRVLGALAAHPVPPALRDEALVERLWALMNSGTAHDWRLRCDAVALYRALFGVVRPSCLPPSSASPEPRETMTTHAAPALETEPGVDDVVADAAPALETEPGVNDVAAVHNPIPLPADDAARAAVGEEPAHPVVRRAGVSGGRVRKPRPPRRSRRKADLAAAAAAAPATAPSEPPMEEEKLESEDKQEEKLESEDKQEEKLESTEKRDGGTAEEDKLKHKRAEAGETTATRSKRIRKRVEAAPLDRPPESEAAGQQAPPQQADGDASRRRRKIGAAVVEGGVVSVEPNSHTRGRSLRSDSDHLAPPETLSTAWKEPLPPSIERPVLSMPATPMPSSSRVSASPGHQRDLYEHEKRRKETQEEHRHKDKHSDRHRHKHKHKHGEKDATERENHKHKHRSREERGGMSAVEEKHREKRDRDRDGKAHERFKDKDRDKYENREVIEIPVLERYKDKDRNKYESREVIEIPAASGKHDGKRERDKHRDRDRDKHKHVHESKSENDRARDREKRKHDSEEDSAARKRSKHESDDGHRRRERSKHESDDSHRRRERSKHESDDGHRRRERSKHESDGHRRRDGDDDDERHRYKDLREKHKHRHEDSEASASRNRERHRHKERHESRDRDRERHRRHKHSHKRRSESRSRSRRDRERYTLNLEP